MNRCIGTLAIECNKELFEQIREFVKSEEKVFDLQKIVPLPIDAEYDDKLEYWGTHENVNSDKVYAYNDEYSFDFETDSSPCSPAVKVLAERYPEAIFRYLYEEDTPGFTGVEAYRNGHLVYKMNAEYVELSDDWTDDYKPKSMIDESILLPDEEGAVVRETGKDREWTKGKIYCREFWGDYVKECIGTVQYSGEPPKEWWGLW